VTIQIKAIDFPVVLVIMIALYKVVLTFESEDEVLLRDLSTIVSNSLFPLFRVEMPFLNRRTIFQ